MWGCRYGLWWRLTAGYCEQGHGFSDTIQGKVFIGNLIDSYNAVNGFWPVEEFAELVDGSAGSGEVASGGCLFAWVTRWTLLRVRTWKGLDQTWQCRSIMHSFLAYRLKIPLAINHALHCSFLKVTTFCGPIKLAEGKICLTGIRKVSSMKFDRNRDYPIEILNDFPLLLQGNLWTVPHIRSPNFLSQSFQFIIHC